MDQIEDLLQRPIAYCNIDGVGELSAGFVCLSFALLQWMQANTPSGAIWHQTYTLVVFVLLMVSISRCRRQGDQQVHHLSAHRVCGISRQQNQMDSDGDGLCRWGSVRRPSGARPAAPLGSDNAGLPYRPDSRRRLRAPFRPDGPLEMGRCLGHRMRLVDDRDAAGGSDGRCG